MQARFSRQRPDLAPQRALEAGGFALSPQAVVRAAGERGTRAVAFVRCDGPFDETALQRFCRERLAGYKVTARIVRLDEFPLTAGANAPKVQKHRLREMALAWGAGI